MFTFPTEIINHIFSYASLKDVIGVNKSYVLPKLTYNLRITLEQKLNYNKHNYLISYNIDKSSDTLFAIIYEGCNEYADYNINLHEFVKYLFPYGNYDCIDLHSMYNILAMMDIYKEKYAKNYILNVLQKRKLDLYIDCFNSAHDIKRFNMWLISNLYKFGLVDEIRYTFDQIEIIKEKNKFLYNQLEQHIKHL